METMGSTAFVLDWMTNQRRMRRTTTRSMRMAVCIKSRLVARSSWLMVYQLRAISYELLFYFQHPIQRPLGRDADIFRHLDDVLHVFHGPEHAFQFRPLHVGTDHLVRDEVEFLVGVFFPEPVEEAFLGADDELPVVRFPAVAE